MSCFQHHLEICFDILRLSRAPKGTKSSSNHPCSGRKMRLVSGYLKNLETSTIVKFWRSVTSGNDVKNSHPWTSQLLILCYLKIRVGTIFRMVYWWFSMQQIWKGQVTYVALGVEKVAQNWMGIRWNMAYYFVSDGCIKTVLIASAVATS